MKTMSLKIEGMSCGHCVMSVKKALANIPGVTVEQVEIGSAVVRIDEAAVTQEMLAAAVAEAGYAVVAGGAEPA